MRLCFSSLKIFWVEQFDSVEHGSLHRVVESIVFECFEYVSGAHMKLFDNKLFKFFRSTITF